MNPHSVLRPYGLQAHRVADLFWTYFDVAALVFVLVVGALVVGLARRRRLDQPEKMEASPEALRGKHRAIGVATGITVVTLIALLVSSVATGRALASLSPKDGVPIKVVARKWWWEFQYPANVAGSQFTTAYELHVPVGKPIELSLESHDVIHSFWVPSLSGKRDAIPGKKTTLVLIADAPGTYEGQCAEFCGTQHANMRFRVVAEDEAAWRAWMKHQNEPAPAPADPVAQAGLTAFEHSRCVTCHTIRGTAAAATVGPDLTHVASRRRIAMGTLADDPGHMGAWIVDPQASKPGVIMPGTPFAPEDLQAVIAYLGSLK